MQRLFVGVSGLLLLVGCELFLEGPEGPALQTGQVYLFEVEYVSFAWGAVWEGLYVDARGRVYRYARDGEPWRPSRDDAYTRAELAEKYRSGRTLLRTLPSDEVVARVALIEPASRGDLSEPASLCRDAGVLTFRAFRYDGSTGRYLPVLLRAEGDWAQENRSPDARALVQWMSGFDDRFASNGGCSP